MGLTQPSPRRSDRVWVDDFDAMYQRVLAAGVSAEPPEDRPFGARMLQVKDAEGYTWGFMGHFDR